MPLIAMFSRTFMTGFIKIQKVPVCVDGLNVDVLSIFSPTCGISAQSECFHYLYIYVHLWTERLSLVNEVCCVDHTKEEKENVTVNSTNT